MGPMNLGMLAGQQFDPYSQGRMPFQMGSPMPWGQNPPGRLPFMQQPQGAPMPWGGQPPQHMMPPMQMPTMGANPPGRIMGGPMFAPGQINLQAMMGPQNPMQRSIGPRPY